MSMLSLFVYCDLYDKKHPFLHFKVYSSPGSGKIFTLLIERRAPNLLEPILQNWFCRSTNAVKLRLDFNVCDLCWSVSLCYLQFCTIKMKRSYYSMVEGENM